MNDNYAKVEKIANEGYSLEFGTVLEDAFNNYKKIAGIAGLAMLLLVVILVVVFGGIIGVAYGFSEFTTTLTGFNPQFMSGSSLLFFLVFSVVFAGIMSPINAGFIKMAYQAHCDKPFGLDTVFYYYKGNYFKELFIATVIITFFSNGIDFLFTHFEILYVGAIFTYVVAFLTFLTIPLIIFSDLKATEALTMSVKLILKQPLLLLGLMVLAVIFAALGFVGFCIGILFTIPFIYSMYFAIYENIIPFSEKSELDEIGQNQE